LYLPFSHLPSYPKLANFESLRKMTTHLYTIINRLISGKTYVDLFSAQSVATPLSTDSVILSKDLPYESSAHIWNKSNIIPVTGILPDENKFVVATGHNLVKGMPVVYKTNSSVLGSLISNRLYWVSEVGDTYIKITDIYQGTVMTSAGSITGTHTFQFVETLTQINEVTKLPRNRTYPDPKGGNLAYGDIVQGTKTTYFYNDGANYRPVKLGWNGGNGYYNNNSTFAQKHTGWCHGIGNYKIITSTNQIKITFDSMEVREEVTGCRDVVTSSATVPSTNYSVLVINSVAGLNSVDTGLITANTGYYVFLVYNPESQTYGAVLSLNHDYPQFPTNTATGTLYRFYQRLGWIRTNSDGAFFPSTQIGKELVFLQKPSNALEFAFSGGGTSVEVPLYSSNLKSSDKYPYPGYLSTFDIYLNWTGTGHNRDISNHGRDIYFNSVPYYQVSTTGTDSTYFPANYVFNDTQLPLYQDIRVSIAHPDDTGGTDTTNIGFSLTGFKFNGELYV
jgi:hypothetical protein